MWKAEMAFKSKVVMSVVRTCAPVLILAKCEEIGSRSMPNAGPDAARA
jgi:hypothetical protein